MRLMMCAREQWIGIRLFVMLAGAILLGGSNGAADESSKFKTSEEFFGSKQVVQIRIEVHATNVVSLRQNSRRYVRVIVREGDAVYRDVGMHVKGAAGSFRDIDQQPALTLNFDKFNEGQKFHGMDKIHLNNSVQDASYMTEILCGEMFREAGVPATRGTHARVSLNGRELGLYVLKEGFDKEFLHHFFRNTRGNLYDGGFLREITEPLQRTSGRDVKDYSDLKAVVAAAQESDPTKRLERLEQVLDMDRFISFIAMEMMTYHWDGYALKKNNYRAYHDLSTGKMVFLAHGMDQMFWDPNFPLLGQMEGLVARQVMETEEGKSRYLQRIGTLFTNVFRVQSLTNRINELQRQIRPVLASINPNAARNHDRAVENLRNQVTARGRFIGRFLNTPAAVPVNFGSNNIVQVRSWRVVNPKGLAQVDTVNDHGRFLLHINSGTDTNCTASWRSHITLPAGEYHFEGLARTAGVISVKDKKGQGAGLRISGTQKTKAEGITGTTEWTRLVFDFPIAPGNSGEVDLLCELRASKGEAWFDLDSLKLTRK